MSDQLPYADIIILALIAGFVLLRLRAVLGQRIGHEGLPQPKNATKPNDEASAQAAEAIARVRAEAQAQQEEAVIGAIADEPLRNAVRAIRKADEQFSLQRFLDGARGAFEMVFDAFNKGDRKTLQMLLSDPLYTMFTAELDRNEAAGRVTETTLIAIESVEPFKAELSGSKARIGVRFLSEQVSVVRDKGGAIIEGDSSRVERVEDEWTFERDTNSRNPNWKIIDT